MTLADVLEPAATLTVVLLGWIVALIGLIFSKRRARAEKRARQVALADLLLVAIVAYKTTLDLHHHTWTSVPSRLKAGLSAIAYALEGRARHGTVLAGIGSAAHGVFAWDAAGTAGIQSVMPLLERMAAAALALDGCGDEGLEAAARRVIDVLPQSGRGGSVGRKFEVAADALAVERRRIAHLR